MWIDKMISTMACCLCVNLLVCQQRCFCCVPNCSVYALFCFNTHVLELILNAVRNWGERCTNTHCSRVIMFKRNVIFFYLICSVIQFVLIENTMTGDSQVCIRLFFLF